MAVLVGFRAGVFGVLLALTGCSWAFGGAPPTASVDCSNALTPKYGADGSPTYCYVSSATGAVAERVRACSELEGTVQVTFDFARDGVPSKVSADLTCDDCRAPRWFEQRTLRDCVEKAASEARLPLEGKSDTFRTVYLFKLGSAEDPRLKLGWSPMERATH